MSGMDGISDAYVAFRRYDASRTGFGRLLFFLRFGKCPTDATAAELALCERLAAEIAKSERQCRRRRASAYPLSLSLPLGERGDVIDKRSLLATLG